MTVSVVEQVTKYPAASDITYLASRIVRDDMNRSDMSDLGARLRRTAWLGATVAPRSVDAARLNRHGRFERDACQTLYSRTGVSR
jgi:hypothetical protein